MVTIVVHSVKIYGGSGYIAPLFLNIALDRDERLDICPGRLTSRGRNSLTVI